MARLIGQADLVLVAQIEQISFELARPYKFVLAEFFVGSTQPHLFCQMTNPPVPEGFSLGRITFSSQCTHTYTNRALCVLMERSRVINRGHVSSATPISDIATPRLISPMGIVGSVGEKSYLLPSPPPPFLLFSATAPECSSGAELYTWRQPSSRSRHLVRGCRCSFH